MNREEKARAVFFLLLGGLFAAEAIAAKPERPPPPPTMSGMKVFAAGQPVGYVLSLYRGNYGDYLTIVSETGYVADFNPLTGAHLNLGYPYVVFTGTNCSGDAYAAMENSSYDWKLQQGMVFTSGSLGYYSVRGATLPAGVNYYSSRYAAGTCSTSTTIRHVQNAVPAFLNDVAVTGIPSDGLPLPIVFGIP